jgi:hypothetical protein
MTVYDQYLLEKILDVKYILYFICALYMFAITISGVLLKDQKRMNTIRALTNVKLVVVIFLFLLMAFCIPSSIDYLG